MLMYEPLNTQTTAAVSRVEEEAQNGAIAGPALMGLADRVHAGEIKTAPAIAEARTTIVTATRRA